MTSIGRAGHYDPVGVEVAVAGWDELILFRLQVGIDIRYLLARFY